MLMVLASCSVFRARAYEALSLFRKQRGADLLTDGDGTCRRSLSCPLVSEIACASSGSHFTLTRMKREKHGSRCQRNNGGQGSIQVLSFAVENLSQTSQGQDEPECRKRIHELAGEQH